MTGSLENKLPENETQEIDPCVNNHKCKNIPKYS